MDQEHFHIWLQRSGGFAGMITEIEINSKDLDTYEAEQFTTMINRSDIFNLPEPVKNSIIMPDQFQYKITIQQDGRKRELDLSEENVPDHLRNLITYILKKGRKK